MSHPLPPNNDITRIVMNDVLKVDAKAHERIIDIVQPLDDVESRIKERLDALESEGISVRVTRYTDRAELSYTYGDREGHGGTADTTECFSYGNSTPMPSLADSINASLGGNVHQLRNAESPLIPSIYGHVMGDALNLQSMRDAMPQAPGYVVKLIESGKAAISIVANMVEAEVECGNRNNIPEELRTWYLLTQCATLSEMEHQAAPYEVRLGQAHKISDAIKHMDKRKGDMELSVSVFARSELAEREVCGCVADRTYGGLIPG
jgi:hypothetical protein